MSDAYDWLENIFVELEEFSRRLTVYMSSDLDAGLKQKIVAILVLLVFKLNPPSGPFTDPIQVCFESVVDPSCS